MGATITCGKVAAALICEGEPFYLLHERTYEKNVHPHQPRWNVVAGGTLSRCYEWIGLATASCIGGALQSTAGCIKPLNYWNGWQRALADPLKMTPPPPFAVQIRPTWLADAWGKLAPDASDKLDEAIRSAGLAPRLTPLASDPEVRRLGGIDLAQDAWKLLALADATGVSLWRLLPRMQGLRDDSSKPDDRLHRLERPASTPREGPPVALSTGFAQLARDTNPHSRAMFGRRPGQASWVCCEEGEYLLGRGIRAAAAMESARPGSVVATMNRIEQELEHCIHVPGLMNQPVSLAAPDATADANPTSSWRRDVHRSAQTCIASAAAAQPPRAATVRDVLEATYSLNGLEDLISIDLAPWVRRSDDEAALDAFLTGSDSDEAASAGQELALAPRG